MTSPIPFPEVWHTAAETAAPYAAQPVATWIPVIAVIMAGALRLLMEWQLRQTLTTIFKQAPGGSVIVIRRRGLGGSMWVQVGTKYMPGTRPGLAKLT